MARGVMLGLLALMVTACGYQWGSGDALPGHVTRLQITMFENRSAETGLENHLTDALSHEFRMRRLSLLAEGEQADGILRGVITAVRTDTVFRQSLAAGGEQRIYVTIDTSLTDDGGNVVWAVTNLSEHETFRAGFDPEENRRYQNEALQKLTRRLAETIYGQLMTGF